MIIYTTMTETNLYTVSPSLPIVITNNESVGSVSRLFYRFELELPNGNLIKIKDISKTFSSNSNRWSFELSATIPMLQIIRKTGYGDGKRLVIKVTRTQISSSGSEHTTHANLYVYKATADGRDPSAVQFTFNVLRAYGYTSQVDISRCDSYGKLDDTGQYILVGCKYLEDGFSDLDNNVPKNIIDSYKLGFNGVDYSNWYFNWDENSGLSNQVTFPYEIDSSNTSVTIGVYQVLYVGSQSGVVYIDGIGSEETKNFPKANTVIPFDIKGNNLGIAFGQSAKDDDFTCNFDANFLKKLSINGYPIVDFVTEQGEGNGWTYRVWYSGKRECWSYLSVSATLATSNGGWYSNGTTGAATQDFPTLNNGENLFTKEPMKFISAENISSTARNVLAGIYYGNVDHVKNFGNYVLFRGNSLSGSNKYNVYMRAIQFDDNIIST